MTQVFGFDLLREQVGIIAAAQVDHLASWWKYGDTPIERLFSLALVVCVEAENIGGSDWGSIWLLEEAEFEQFFAKPEAVGNVLVRRQVQMESWRVDFVLQAHRYLPPDYSRGEWRYVIVECDGHEYHERTKEQAARDRSRDRQAVISNIPVLRFTGSELWRDPQACVRQALQAVKGGT